jgi:subtilisin family serine protease
MAQEKTRIAIIDSGVRLDHPAFVHKPPVMIDTGGSGRRELVGHGTAVYNIIRKVEDNADILNFSLDYRDEGVEESELLELLETIDREYPVQLINLSLGMVMCEDRESLYQVCKSLTDKGVIIVSAFDNAGAISYPAAFENVIGVTAGQHCRHITDFEYYRGQYCQYRCERRGTADCMG